VIFAILKKFDWLIFETVEEEYKCNTNISLIR